MNNKERAAHLAGFYKSHCRPCVWGGDALRCQPYRKTARCLIECFRGQRDVFDGGHPFTHSVHWYTKPERYQFDGVFRRVFWNLKMFIKAIWRKL